MITALKNWYRNQHRQANRDRSIRLTIDIPYSEQNEIALRGLTVSAVELRVHDAVGNQVAPQLEKVVVRCVSNPNWRN